MSISAIICTRNRPSWLEWSLSSLAHQELPPIETILVDGSDEDDAARNKELVVRYEGSLENLTYIRSAPGITRQRNTGVAASTGDIVLFVDDDALLHPSYCRMTSELFDARPTILGAGGLIWNEPRRSTLANAFRRLFTMTDNLRPAVTASGDAGHLYDCEGIREVQVLSGSNMAFRRAVFTNHDLSFDETLRGYGFGEDQLFCLKVSEKGTLVQNGDALVMHGFRRKDRLSADYARDQVTHAAYIFAVAGRERGGRVSALMWRLFGRTLYEVVNGMVRWRWDAAGGALKGLVHVLRHGGNLGDDAPLLLESRSSTRPDVPARAAGGGESE
jgi:GT2 family glycosyltransferase